MKYAFDNANLINGTQDMRVQPGLCVLTDGETITDIVPAGTAPAGYARIDLHGRYLLPGLINMHVHLAGNGKIQKKQRDLETLVRRILANPVARGGLPHGVLLCTHRAARRRDDDPHRRRVGHVRHAPAR